MFAHNPFDTPEHYPFSLNGPRPAALLVHGYPGTPREMRPLAEALHDSGWTAHALLLPGFGPEMATLSAKTADDWRLAVSRALSDLRRDGHTPLILVGNSMGAALSLSVAAETPPDALILLAPFWKLPGLLWQSLPLMKRLFPQVRPFRLFKPDFNNPDFRKGAANFAPGADLDDPAVRQAIRDFTLPVGMFDEIRKAGLGGTAAAARVRVPTLIIQGRQDPLVRPALTRRLAARLAGPVEWVEVDAQHDLHDPTKAAFPQVRQAVLDFVHRIK